jgi:dienelactone hydrolase
VLSRFLRIVAIAVVVLIAAAVALVLLYRWEGEHPRFLQPKARAAHAAFMAPGLRLVTPPGPGPFPTVLLIHGCGGLRGDNGPNPIMDEYAQTAAQAGWAGAILDSYGPRGWAPAWARRRVCAGARLNGLQRSADILAGLDLLAADLRVDHRHVRIAGWSHGGWALGDLLTLKDRGDGQFKRTMSAVEAVQLMYPFCARPARAPRRPWTWSGAVRLVLAEHDVVQPPAGCMPLAAQARRAGASVEVITMPGVTHAFDERVQTPTSRFRFDPAATARSHADFKAWLETRKGDGRPVLAPLAR